MDLNLGGKVALFTGASRGIGASIDAELAREGVHVCLAARDKAKLDETAGGIAAIPGCNRTTVIGGDLREPAASKTAVDAAVAPFGRIDILANNVGATRRADCFGRSIERESREHGFNREQAVAYLLSSHGTTRVGRPEETGWLTAYLASAKVDFIRGCVIDIDGGATRSL
jgi:NAD(P)-dependent dehydrogenase (short-subunit alcohol dehydrogenase family)